MRPLVIHAAACLLASTTVAAAQAPASAGAASAVTTPDGRPRIRRISTAAALSTEPIGAVLSIRELPDGRILVNDGQRRRLILMDTMLAVVRIVLDSLTDVENSYGLRPGRLLPFRADSSLFLDPASYAMIVIDPDGNVTRVRSVWRVQDMVEVTRFSNPIPFGIPGSDARGRIVYRVQARPGRPKVRPPPGVPWFPQEPDSAFIVAADVDTRTVDTLASIRTPKNHFVVTRRPDGGYTVTPVVNPLPASDDWAVLSDGSVALIRSRDYSIEYINPDGTRDTSAKLPFEWVRMTDSDKEQLIDSLRRLQNRQLQSEYVTAMIRWVNTWGSKKYPRDFTVPSDYTLPQGLLRTWVLPAGLRFPERYIHGCSPGEEPTLVERNAAAPTRTPPGSPAGVPSCIPQPTAASEGIPPMPVLRAAKTMDPAELPDYRPPIAHGGSARADADGRLWVRTVPTRPIAGGLVYDIIDRSGRMVDRLQIPPGYTLAGFGRKGVVYLTTRDERGMRLARVRLR